MYVEEVDFCYRAKKHGWHVWYVSSEAITHLGGASGNSEFTILSELKNIQYFYKKHFPFFLPLLRIFLKVGILIRIVLYGILNTAKGRIYAKAFTKI
jgi:GT2 family glycosyltransferase